MSKDPDPDPTCSSIESPTASYPREALGPMKGKEFGHWTATPARSPPAPKPKGSKGVSWWHLGLALVGGGPLAVGVSGLVGLLFFAGS